MGVDEVRLLKALEKENARLKKLVALAKQKERTAQRDSKLLSQEVWASVLEAHVMCQQWTQTYNERRPHGPLSMKTPSSFAQEAKQQGCWYHQR